MPVNQVEHERSSTAPPSSIGTQKNIYHGCCRGAVHRAVDLSHRTFSIHQLLAGLCLVLCLRDMGNAEWDSAVCGEEEYKAVLTRIPSSAVESLLSGLGEKDLPHHWRDFQALMRQIERHPLDKAALISSGQVWIFQCRLPL